METVIIQTEYAVFMFDQKQVKELIARKKSVYDPDEITWLLELISTDSYKTILNPDDNNYFGYVALDLISGGQSSILCNICRQIYDACQLKEFDINREQKGGIRPFDKRSSPSMFGGKEFTCPEDHKLISMKTWRT